MKAVTRLVFLSMSFAAPALANPEPGLGGERDDARWKSRVSESTPNTGAEALTAGAFNFRVGLQVADAGTRQPGEATYTNDAIGTPVLSDWAVDGDAYDPDSVRVHLELRPGELTQDVRLGIQVSDAGATGGGAGPIQWSHWASEGSGQWSATAFDSDHYDPDAFRIILENRPWPRPGFVLKDVRIGIQMFDAGGAEAGFPQHTPWASEGGGWSSWATDLDAYDPDGISIKLEARVEPG